MSEIRDLLIRRLWAGQDPLANAEAYSDRADPQGWGHDHPYLTEMIDEVRPHLIVEVGVWKGASTIAMAQRLRDHGIEGVVLAVDTWLGSWDIWIQAGCFNDLRMEDGYPTLYRTFLANIAKSGLIDYVVPLPLDAQSAAQLVEISGIGPIDLVHIDAGHDYDAVMMCLHSWWPKIRSGGILIGDDYTRDGPFPQVAQAFDDAFGRDRIQHHSAKCLVRKP